MRESKSDLLKGASERGFSLVEIVFAMAIFVVVLGITAQGLAYSYGVMNLQNQRGVAQNDCRAIVSALRQVAMLGVPTDACPADEPRFPCLLMEWVDNFPEDREEVEALGGTERAAFESFYSLRDQVYTITFEDGNGNPANASAILDANTNPVFVTVTSTWTGPRGITYQTELTTVVTDR